MRRNNIKELIKEYFFQNPTSKVRVRELERLLNVPLPSVIRYCKELKEENILTIEKIGNVSFYTANKTHPNFLLEKRIYNLRSLYSCGLVNFLKKELSNPTIVLFGSYARGEDLENSDIDLYIETPSHKSVSLGVFEKKLKRKIQIFRYTSIFEVKNKNLANNIINGIVINGFVEVFK